MSDMSDLADWLAAQIDTDEALARDQCLTREGEPYEDGSGVAYRDSFPSYPWGLDAQELEYMAGVGHPRFVLADLAAKRRIIELHRRAKFTNVDLDIRDADVCLICHSVLDEPNDWPEDQEWPYPLVQDAYPCLTVRLLALPYADRGGYRQDWRP